MSVHSHMYSSHNMGICSSYSVVYAYVIHILYTVLFCDREFCDAEVGFFGVKAELDSLQEWSGLAARSWKKDQGPFACRFDNLV